MLQEVEELVKSECTDTRAIQIYLPLSYVQWLDKLVRGGYYCSRSEAIRVAVWDLLRSERQLVK